MVDILLEQSSEGWKWTKELHVKFERWSWLLKNTVICEVVTETNIFSKLFPLYEEVRRVWVRPLPQNFLLDCLDACLWLDAFLMKPILGTYVFSHYYRDLRRITEHVACFCMTRHWRVKTDDVTDKDAK